MLRKLALCLILLGACVTYPIAPDTVSQEQDTFTYVCEQVTNLYPLATCEGVAPPVVVLTQLTAALYAYGIYFPGEIWLFVDPDGDHVAMTIVHETAHYVLYETTGLLDRCKSEELARFIAGQTGEWRTRYGCVKGM